MQKRGILIVVSGFAGSGKGTVMKELLSQYDDYALSISATTRAPREGEEHGKHYFFVSVEEFERMIRDDELLEHAQYVSNYYGTPKSYVEKELAAGKDVILEIETKGALLVKEKHPETLLLFIMPPRAGEIYERLKKRGTESEEVILKRMAKAREEAGLIDKYDYLVINDDLEDCVKQIHEIIRSVHCRVDWNRELIEEMKEGLRAFSEGTSLS